MRILLAEDNLINQTFLAVKLSEAGHDVTIAGDGREAVAAFESAGDHAFDLVLMDVQMPGMDGIEATGRIRAMPGPASEVPIVALTAFAMAGDEERFLHAGMNAYVTKPIEWTDLARVVRSLRTT